MGNSKQIYLIGDEMSKHMLEGRGTDEEEEEHEEEDAEEEEEEDEEED
ncbi:MAG: hypothetical protein Sv326_0610 [Candidatus Fermentimicrarchaeum limneticum]|uniref:Uncharacterized protein n=1 Tax=Fermentimicrarchaeum limneticum TaxID=2795018 RepID=A0A7D5XC66_FERL1|nr:MAG: hypothetical protein Sv326_0610 [Candidatus Fermentimicrarchaeum limneticum]